MIVDLNTFDLTKFRNRAGVVWAYADGVTLNPAHPVELILEVTDHCNLACPMCPRPNMTRPLGHMTLDIFKSIIDQIKDTIELVYLSGGLGEPLMHPKIFEFIKYARNNGVRLGISTNATVLSPKMADQLLQNPPSLMLMSLDGATKATHEAIRIGSTFEKTIANVEHFLEEKHRRGLRDPYAIVQMVYMPENAHEAAAFHSKWSGYPALDDIRLKRFLALQGAEKRPDAMEDPHEKLSCILPWRQLSIAWDGSLALCCRDLNFKDSMGNVKDTPISEIWNSPKMRRYRELLATGRKSEIELCAGCETVKTTPLTRLGSVMFDDLTIRKLLPYVEKAAIKLGVKLGEY